ncbi:hypothetical protein CEE37_13335 [candidate division LCP-89 bacterium B3_LCP]|uniref:Major facilitator superfamily (MFS) profile domain-containing protein n=1 Tax=candidate division LCP-89 bacterium B3_LCP TaxID=2012998 RepID=A0A532USS2_UNCL8|nr:MAG: hypothetical protein CEE37_13335 [candidate division LCP-89 bacterium B3_LCP]
MLKLLHSPFLRPLRARNFRLLWIGQVIAWTGDSIYQIALLWLILEMTGSKSLAGYIAAVGYLPALLLGLFLGALVDVGDRRRLMMGADLLRAIVLLYIPLAFIGNWLTPWQLAAAAFFISTGAALFNPARDSSVPQLVDEKNLLAANALIQTSSYASLLIGPLFAGLVLTIINLTGLFFFNSFAYAISLFTIFLLRIPSRDNIVSTFKPLKSILEALRYAAREKWSGQLLLLTALDNLFIMGPAIVGIPILVREELGLGPGAYAAVQGCHAVGMLIGAFIFGSLGKSLPKGKTLLAAIVFDGLTFIPIMFITNLTWLGILIVFHSLAIPLIMVSRTSLIQEGIPSGLQGRFFSLVNLTVIGMMALSSAMTGIACEIIGVRQVYLVIGIAGGLCGLLGFLMKGIRQRR